MVKGLRKRNEKDMGLIVEEIIGQIENLTPISHISQKIMAILSDPLSSLSEIVEVIQYDQNITANLLRICNSSYFGLRKKIVSIRQAVAYLGLEKVANLVIMGSSARNFKGAQEGYDLKEGELWRYSVASALLAQKLAEERGAHNLPLIFTSALLKDIGKVILSSYVQEAFEDILKRVESQRFSFNEAEKEILGIDHAELGAIAAEKWNFNPHMVSIIRNHHNPDMDTQNDLPAQFVYLADSICMMVGIGLGADGLSYRYLEEVMDRLHFTHIDLQEAMADLWEKLQSIEEMVNLSQGDH